MKFVFENLSIIEYLENGDYKIVRGTIVLYSAYAKYSILQNLPPNDILPLDIAIWNYCDKYENIQEEYNYVCFILREVRTLAMSVEKRLTIFWTGLIWFETNFDQIANLKKLNIYFHQWPFPCTWRQNMCCYCWYGAIQSWLGPDLLTFVIFNPTMDK